MTNSVLLTGGTGFLGTEIAAALIRSTPETMLADEETGTTDGRRISKTMSASDRARMKKAVKQSRQILERMGVSRETQFLGTLNAGHPGGMLPLTSAEKDNLHNPALPANLYIVDATILPASMGNPPILTIMALAKRIARCIGDCSDSHTRTMR